MRRKDGKMFIVDVDRAVGENVDSDKLQTLQRLDLQRLNEWGADVVFKLSTPDESKPWCSIAQNRVANQ